MMVELSGGSTYGHKNHETVFQKHLSYNQITRQRSWQYEVYHQSIHQSLLLLRSILYILWIVVGITLSLPKQAESRLRWVWRNWSTPESGRGSSPCSLEGSSGGTIGDSGGGWLESWPPRSFCHTKYSGYHLSSTETYKLEANKVIENLES